MAELYLPIAVEADVESLHAKIRDISAPLRSRLGKEVWKWLRFLAATPLPRAK